jgi:hypothetical protein
MAHALATPWPPPDEPSDTTTSRLELYRLAVEEYRFQAEYNWRRTQYLLAFNVAVAALGIALEPRSSVGAVTIFALGLVAALLTVLVVRVMHGYYRHARDRMTRLEGDLRVPESWKVDTTAALGHRPRRASVTQLVYVLLAAIAVSDVANIVIALR